MIIRILPCLYRPLSISNGGFKRHSFSVGIGGKYFLLIRPSGIQGSNGSHSISLKTNKQKHPTKNKHVKGNVPWELSTALIYLVMKDINKNVCMENTKSKHNGNDWFQS